MGFPSVSVCVHNGRSNTSAAAELAEFRKITAFNEHPVYPTFVRYLSAIYPSSFSALVHEP